MELEQVKAAWQREMAAYPCETDATALMDYTIKKAEQKDREFRRRQIKQILYGIFCLGMMASFYRREGPLFSNAGLILMLLCLALMLAGSVILKYRLRAYHPWLPEQEFLAEERKKIIDQIALLRRNLMWFSIPAILGLLMWQIGPSPSVPLVVALTIIVIIASAGAFWLYRRKIRRDLLPILEDIDRELEYLREHPEPPLDD